MSSDSVLDKLVDQFKSNDVDIKVEALNKLQAQIESGTEIENPETFVNIFKGCLRSSNQHLTAAAVSTLSPLLPLIVTHPQNGVVDPSTLRLILTSLLPLVMDRLGDKDKIQVKARESVALLGGYSLKLSSSVVSTRSRDGKGSETPGMIFERMLKELGLASKVWKIREQSILALVSIRRSYTQFPMRPYLSLLVDCLEDTDAHVRDCARTSVVELFTGPGVTDAARADLKKEMIKKNVRKTIMDGVLSKLLGASSAGSSPQSHEGSENGDTNSTRKDYVPPSLMLQGKRPRVPSQGTPAAFVPNRTASHSNTVKDLSRPASRAGTATPPPSAPSASSDNAEVQTIFIASSRDLENEFLAMAKSFEGKETEHNWAAREQAILRVRGMLKGDVHLRYSDVFIASLKDGFMQWSLKTLVSLRTTVATNTCQLYLELANNLGSTLDPFCDLLLTNLLKMGGLTKKITAQQSQSSVTGLLTCTSAQPRLIIPLLWTTLQEKTVQARAFAVAHIKTYLDVHGQRSKNAIEASGNLEVLDKCIRKSLGDTNPSVRETARKLFWDFDEIWPENGKIILDSLDATARKQLDKACPSPDRQSLPPTTPKAPKKGSVAAAIAASRAKAKAIATAPPTLRHQATSASHNIPNQRRSGSPGSPTNSSKNSRPSSPLRLSSSPPTIRGSAAISRSVTAPILPSHTRVPSGGSGRGTSPIPMPPEPSTVRRGTSSNSSTSPARGSTMRKAMRTALPASPPTSPPQPSPTPRATGILSRNAPVPLPPRASTLFPQMSNGMDESLLLAQSVPIPLDDESEDDTSVHLMSFSSPFRNFPAPIRKPLTPPDSRSPKSNDSKPGPSVSNALSSGSIATTSAGDQPIIEDALKARAEQAESAAERLLELVEPETEGAPHLAFPPSLLVGNQNGGGLNIRRPPVTPANKASHILKQAAMFQDSPAYSGQASLLDVLQGAKQESWWSRRRPGVLLRQSREGTEPLVLIEECIAALSSGSVDGMTFYRIAGLSLQNPVADSPPTSPATGPSSPTPFNSSRSIPSLHWDVWDKDKNFERLFKAIIEQLTPDKDGDILEAGLVALSAFIENQFSHLEGKEAELFFTLLHVRYCNKVNILEATNAVRDMLTAKLEPVYGLTTIHASLKDFHTTIPPSAADAEVKAAAYAFGLIALGKFVLRLPAEVAEEELPRLKMTFISALSDKSSLIIRESAAASIIAAQLVLRDETHLFALLDGLADDKKNLLTYLFDKHGARGMNTSDGTSGLDKLEREIRRLDTRTSTPSRTCA
ncbi:hypothetical protein P691DRAFT_811482 [Macrolepiota fuliginosa MF-IS2]|uniref:TOG domain-containing protein n=1 Tax=Macrolepiota fuliginosa MF-IS2 TaxID=1400762 RepID=A0A9P6C2T4_9AGAR|nr:hypothetical protein P691DRAFT_811482 [Macrolepiota fuliginosa MF-IS2]